MDAVLPPYVAGAMRDDPSVKKRRGSPYSVRWADGELSIVELTPNGFVVAADSPPPLRGYTDIFDGEERILHGLVMCTWARDGLVGYEFKRGSGVRQVRPDHAPPAHSGLLEAPE